jgi:hypothetical protein
MGSLRLIVTLLCVLPAWGAPKPASTRKPSQTVLSKASSADIHDQSDWWKQLEQAVKDSEAEKVASQSNGKYDSCPWCREELKVRPAAECQR